MPDRTLRGRLEFEYSGTAAEKAERDIRDIGKAGDDAKTGIQKAEQSSLGLKSALGALGVTLGAGVLAKKIFDLGAASIEAASNVAEMSSKFGVVFGEAAPRTEQALGELANTINRSRYDLMGYAATLQDTFVPLGFAREQAADMSIAVVKLAEDLASFNNLRTEDVVRDIQSALVGNTETLRKYGVVASEAAIQQEAINSGLVTNKNQIDANIKAQAIYQLTIKGTADAQGDAERTADSYENVSKGLESAILDLKVAIGEGLIPTMAEAKKEATDLISTTARFWSAANLLREAQELGVITMLEYYNQMALLTYGTDTGADVMERLADKVADANAALAGGGSVARGAGMQQARLWLQSQQLTRAQQNQAHYQELLNERVEWYAALANDAGDASSRYEESMAGVTMQTARAAAEEARRQELLEALNKESREAIHITRELADGTGRYFTAALEADKETSLYGFALDDLGTKYVRVSNLTATQKDDLDRLRDAYDRAGRRLHDYEIGLDGAGMSAEELAKAMQAERDEMARLQAIMDPLLAVTDSYSAVTHEATFNQAALGGALLDAAESAGANIETMYLLTAAIEGSDFTTGNFTKEQLRAALASATMRAGIIELGKKIAEGMSIPDALKELDNLQRKLEEPYTVEFDNKKLVAALDLLRDISSELDALDGRQTRSTHTVETVHTDSGGGGKGGGTKTPGPPSGGPVPAQHGLNMIVPAGYGQDNYLIGVSSGEHVKVTPKGQLPGGINIHVYAAPGMSEERLAAKVAQRARLALISGQGATGR